MSSSKNFSPEELQAAQETLTLWIAIQPCGIDQELIGKVPGREIDPEQISLQVATFKDQARQSRYEFPVKDWAEWPVLKELEGQFFQAKIRPNFRALLEDDFWQLLLLNMYQIYSENNLVEDYQTEWDKTYFSPNTIKHHPPGTCLIRAAHHGRLSEAIDLARCEDISQEDRVKALRTGVTRKDPLPELVDVLTLKVEQCGLFAALIDAASKGHLNLMKVLDRYISYDPEHYPLFPFVVAAYGGHLEVLKDLLPHVKDLRIFYMSALAAMGQHYFHEVYMSNSGGDGYVSKMLDSDDTNKPLLYQFRGLYELGFQLPTETMLAVLKLVLPRIKLYPERKHEIDGAARRAGVVDQIQELFPEPEQILEALKAEITRDPRNPYEILRLIKLSDQKGLSTPELDRRILFEAAPFSLLVTKYLLGTRDFGSDLVEIFVHQVFSRGSLFVQDWILCQSRFDKIRIDTESLRQLLHVWTLSELQRNIKDTKETEQLLIRFHKRLGDYTPSHANIHMVIGSLGEGRELPLYLLNTIEWSWRTPAAAKLVSELTGWGLDKLKVYLKTETIEESRRLLLEAALV